MGWDKLNNGELLLATETEEYEAIMTTGRARWSAIRSLAAAP